jgi:hypothetical protein
VQPTTMSLSLLRGLVAVAMVGACVAAPIDGECMNMTIPFSRGLDPLPLPHTA